MRHPPAESGLAFIRNAAQADSQRGIFQGEAIKIASSFYFSCFSFCFSSLCLPRLIPALSGLSKRFFPFPCGFYNPFIALLIFSIYPRPNFHTSRSFRSPFFSPSFWFFQLFSASVLIQSLLPFSCFITAFPLRVRVSPPGFLWASLFRLFSKILLAWKSTRQKRRKVVLFSRLMIRPFGK